jgi:hypothetical protein
MKNRLLERFNKSFGDFISEKMLGRPVLGKSGGGPPQSKTLRVYVSHGYSRQRLGLRQPSGALVRAKQRTPASA